MQTANIYFSDLCSIDQSNKQIKPELRPMLDRDEATVAATSTTARKGTDTIEKVIDVYIYNSVMYI